MDIEREGQGLVSKLEIPQVLGHSSVSWVWEQKLISATQRQISANPGSLSVLTRRYFKQAFHMCQVQRFGSDIGLEMGYERYMIRLREINDLRLMEEIGLSRLALRSLSCRTSAKYRV